MEKFTIEDKKVPYTKNTRTIRMFLEKHGYSPLSFFQGGEYVYPVVSTCANAKSTWKVYDYSTFKEKDASHQKYLTDAPLTEEEFIKAIQDAADFVLPGEEEKMSLYYSDLFNFFVEEHSLVLLDSQIQEIINEVKKFIKSNN